MTHIATSVTSYASSAFKGRMPVLLLFCMLSSQCAHAPKNSSQVHPPSRAEQKIEWHVVSKNPVIMCPKGYQLPPQKRFGMYVFLADRSKGFFIPDNAPPAVLKEALEFRSASFSPTEKTLASLKDKTNWIFELTAALTLGLIKAAGAFGETSV